MTERRAGFSLVEVVLVLAVTALVLGGVLLFWRSSTQVYQYGAERVDAQQESRAAVEWLMRIVRNASVVVKAEEHGLTVLDPGGMVVTFYNLHAVFTYTTAEGRIVTEADPPESIHIVTVRLKMFQSSAMLRNQGGEREPATPEPCALGAYVPDGWNVFCAPGGRR